MGRLLVVTSDDGSGPIKRVINHIPLEFRHRALLSTSDGAALFHVSDKGDIKPVEGYCDGHCLPKDRAYLEEVYEVARQIFLSFFRSLIENPASVDSLDQSFRDAYQPLIAHDCWRNRFGGLCDSGEAVETGSC